MQNFKIDEDKITLVKNNWETKHKFDFKDSKRSIYIINNTERLLNPPLFLIILLLNKGAVFQLISSFT